MGIATLGSLATVVCRSRLDSAVPDGVPADAVATAHDSVTAAVATAAATTVTAWSGLP
jgi:hypothetical protein